MDEQRSRAAAPPAAPRRRQDLISPRALLRIVRSRNFDLAVEFKAFIKDSLGELSCRPGCAHCCVAKIITDAGTGAIIYAGLVQEGRWTPALEQRLIEADRAMATTSHHDWYDRRQPCVFLGRDQLCSVYPYRPINCAATFSVSDPDLCREGTEGRGSFQIMPKNAHLLVEIPTAIMERAGEAEVWLLTLPGAVLYGRALVEDLPRPQLARMEHRPGEGGAALVKRFDEHAASFYGAPAR